MSLYLELGNTNLKAAYADKNDYFYLGSVANHCIENNAFYDLLELYEFDIDSVYLISVAAPEIETSLISRIKENWKVYPNLLKTEPESCGLLNGYDDFSKLGVDRWMAMIALHSNKPYIVVDAGTALTIDVVIDKQHQGGFIVPGLGLMHHSLESGTSLLTKSAPEEKSNMDSLLATNTQEAIHGGTLYMLSNFVNSVLLDLELETGRKFQCYGTGGDFLALEPLLSKDFNYIEDLTLLGMAEVIKNLKK